MFGGKKYLQPIIIDISENRILAVGYSIDYKTGNIIIQQIGQSLLPFGVINSQGIINENIFLTELENAYIEAKGSWKSSGIVFGVSGSLVEVSTQSVSVNRKKPHKPIRHNEWIQIIDDVYSQIDAIEYHGIYGHNLPLKLVQVSSQSIAVDSSSITEPFGLKGNIISFDMFSTYLPEQYTYNLMTAARQLGVQIEGIYHRGYAVAQLVRDYHTSQDISVILIDIRFDHTIISIIHNHTLAYTQTFSIGSHSFTQSIANAFQITIDEAEGIRQEYSQLQLPRDMARRITDALETDISLWLQSIIIGLQGYASHHVIPENIFLYGEGAQLLGIKEALEYSPWYTSFNHQLKPRVSLLYPKQLPHIVDMTNTIDSPSKIDILGLIHTASMAGDIYIPYRVTDEL
jgi:cell division ATPase FtsA